MTIDGDSNAFVEQAQVTDNLGPAFVVDLNSSVDARGGVGFVERKSAV